MTASATLHDQQRRLNAVVLDWAGTTVDFGSRAPVLALEAIFERHGVRIEPQQIRPFMGRSKRDHIWAILNLQDVARRWIEKHGTEPSRADVETLYETFTAVQEECLRKGADVIPGTLETVAECRRRGLKIGSSTGYFGDQMNIVVPVAAQQGYEPDAIVCADDVPAGRPAPWMCFENAMRLNVYPMETVVKVDDTVVGIEAGRNAGTWTVGISESGNLVGLSLEEFRQAEQTDRQLLVDSACEALRHAGAHFVIPTIADLPGVLDQIEQQMANGKRP